MSEVLCETFIRCIYSELNSASYLVENELGEGGGGGSLVSCFSISVQNMVSLQVGESWSIYVYAC